MLHEELNLLPGERLLWSGKPERRPRFDAVEGWGLLLSALWVTFAVVWTLGARNMGAPDFFMLWGGLFVLYGLFMLLGQPILRRLRLRSTRYAVTDRRVIVVSDRPWPRRMESYLRDLPPPVYRTIDRQSVGSVAFGSFPGFQDALQELNFGKRKGSAPVVLREISQPRNVRDTIASAQTRHA